MRWRASALAALTLVALAVDHDPGGDVAEATTVAPVVDVAGPPAPATTVVEAVVAMPAAGYGVDGFPLDDAAWTPDHVRAYIERVMPPGTVAMMLAIAGGESGLRCAPPRNHRCCLGVFQMHLRFHASRFAAVGYPGQWESCRGNIQAARHLLVEVGPRAACRVHWSATCPRRYR